MRFVVALPLLAAAALSACNSAEEPKTQAEVEEAAADLVKPLPGLYKSTAKLVSFEVPGMPPEQAERMKQMFSTTSQGREYCLTAEDAAEGMEGAVKKLAEGDCKYDRFEASGNTLDARLTCATGQDMTATIAMKGTMREDGSQMTMDVQQNAPGAAGGSVKMVAEIASERVGDCPKG